MSQKAITIISIAVLIFIAGTILLWQASNLPIPLSYDSYPRNSPTQYPIYSPRPTPAPLSAKKPVPVSPPIYRDSNVTWLEEAQPLQNPPSLFSFVGLEGNDGQSIQYAKEKEGYYKLGVDNGNDIILARAFIFDCMGDCFDYYFFVRKQTGYEFLVHPSGEINTLESYHLLRSDVAIDAQTSYHGLEIPTVVSFAGQELDLASNPFSNEYLFHEYENYSYNGQPTQLAFLKTIPTGALYSMEANHKIGELESTGTKLQKFAVRLPSNIAHGYQAKNPEFISDDSMAHIKWNDGTKNKSAYSSAGFSGCGTPSWVVTAEVQESDIQRAGTTSTGEVVYEYKNANHPVLKSFYDAFGGRYYQYDPQTQEGQDVKFSLVEYHANHGVILYHDVFGTFDRWVVFHNLTYGGGAECGKPVIYLYPTEPTQVSVKVGAHITVSDPEYIEGWNVLAEPTGKQTLFWEGLGNGPYPEIAQGFVVKQADLEATLWDHLKQLGLNARESADFMKFWLPKMPTTPYTRLTWFGTRQMDMLAPLTIIPKPDTVIRIFLDFEGLEQPISIPSQRLSSIPRKGFTAVEWGGLLRK